MKTILTIVVCSTVVGLVFGASLALMQIRPAAPLPVLAVPQSVVEPQRDLPGRQTDEKAPQAEVPETTFRFGVIELGASRSHLFKILNQGGSPLEIEVGSTTCKCTVGSLAENEIQPGESTEVRLEWVAKPRPGPFRHSATLLTNDPAQPQIQLTVEGKIIASTLQLIPEELSYGTVQAGQTREADLDLMSFADEYFEVLKYEFSSDELREKIEVHIEPLEKKDFPVPDAIRGFKIKTTYRAGKTLGLVRGKLTLTTNIKKAEEFVIPVLAHVVGDIVVYGPGWNAQQGLLRLGRVRSAEGKRVRLNVTVRGDRAKTTEFEVARVDPPELKATLGERRELNDKLVHVPLFVEIPAGTKSMLRLGEPTSTDAMIVLRTTNPESPEVQLRVNFSVSR